MMTSIYRQKETEELWWVVDVHTYRTDVGATMLILQRCAPNKDRDGNIRFFHIHPLFFEETINVFTDEIESEFTLLGTQEDSTFTPNEELLGSDGMYYG